MLKIKNTMLTSILFAIGFSCVFASIPQASKKTKVTTIKIKMGKGAKIPRRGTKDSAGYDLASVERVIIRPGEIKKVRIGIKTEIPPGYELQIRPRSGLSSKHGISVVGSPGTVDADYRGDWTIPMINLGKKTFIIEPGMRIAQMVLNKVPESEIEVVDSLSETERGEGGFGHTGLH